MTASTQPKPIFTIAVRSLVEQLLRSGDLRHDFFGSVRAVEGIRAHQQIQRRRPPHYKAEAPVDFVVDYPDFKLNVTGRIDGVIIENDRLVVEEIKTTRRSLTALEDDPNPVHWGQVKCYAYIWATENRHQGAIVRLTYMNMDSGKVQEIDRYHGIDELAAFFDEIIGRYAEWISRLDQWVKERNHSIQQLDFPFNEYRPGQRKMAVAAYRTILEGSHLLLQAATGIGKTMGALFPAIKSLNEGLADKVVFLTARTTGRLAAESAVRRLAENGLRIKTITITAKEKICFYPESVCGPEECECTKGYFDRINDAILSALNHDAITRDTLEAVAKKHQVCPFEFTLELVNWCDCIICDYNYAFAPGVMLQRLFGEEGGSHAVLVDEAHNLVDRSRDMFSAQLTKKPILDLRRLIKDELPKIYKSLGRINGWMAVMRRQCNEAGGSMVENTLPDDLMGRLHNFLLESERWLALNLRTDFRDSLLELFFEVARFIKIAEGFDSSYTVIYESDANELKVKQYCIDPSGQLKAAWDRCRSALLFSATLTPAGYFKSILGCRDDAKALNLPSPFPPSNLTVFVADQISTLYRQRKESCGQVVKAIIKLVEQRKGHYLVFFPSYEYMQMVHQQLIRKRPLIKVLEQQARMTEEQKELFLSSYNAKVTQTLVGFAVMGGVFGEGIDLRGERLTGAVIVGVGLPGICIERDLIRDYFDKKNRNGFEFAYQYPGINRVLQAAGRVIRSETDRGTILLIDRRYREKRYQNLLPATWDLRRS